MRKPLVAAVLLVAVIASRARADAPVIPGSAAYEIELESIFVERARGTIEDDYDFRGGRRTEAEAGGHLERLRPDGGAVEADVMLRRSSQVK